jgi:hypothetical protein
MHVVVSGEAERTLVPTSDEPAGGGSIHAWFSLAKSICRLMRSRLKGVQARHGLDGLSDSARSSL